MKIDNSLKLDFSDVLLVPKRSTLSSRNEVKLERTIYFKSGVSWTGIPIMVANMDTTGTIEMARVLQKFKMITCLHKFHNIGDIPDDLDKNYFAISTGIKEEDLAHLDEMMSAYDSLFICVDVANGYSINFHNVVKDIRKKYPSKVIIAGNVVTREMVEELIINCGVDIVKCGIGGGSVCTTRKLTGVGYPQFSMVMECADAAHGLGGYMCSDGGIVVVGDIGKAFGGGADFVMCGSMFAGHYESGGDEFTDDKGDLYKMFYGMSSSQAMNKHYGGVATYRSAEGKCVKVKHRGYVEYTLLEILGGIRSTMTYIGARELKHISKCASFIRVNNQLNKIYDGKEL